MSKTNIDLVYEALLSMTDDEIIEATSLLKSENIKKYYSSIDAFASEKVYYQVNATSESTDLYNLDLSCGIQLNDDFNKLKLSLAS